MLLTGSLYYEAFWVLSRSRQIGASGVMALTITDIKAYLDLIDEHDPDVRLTYLHYLQQMDGAYLEHQYSKAEAKAK